MVIIQNESFKRGFSHMLRTGETHMSQVQVQSQTPQEKIFELKYPYYVGSNGRLGVVLKRRDGKPMVAFLDPARIKRVVMVATPWRPHSKFSLRSLVMVKNGFVYEERFSGDEEVEELRREHPNAAIYPDHVVSTYIVYETSHDYYKPAELERIDGVVIKEGGLELLGDRSKYVKPCGKLWRVYLAELERWDSYCFDLATAFSILKTNIHPVYGVMD
jgi:hypothetical protein